MRKRRAYMECMINEGLSRRGFLGGVAALGAFAGCKTGFFAAEGERPILRFGVVSDVHVRLAEGGKGLAAGYDTETLEKTFAYFRDRGADAVMIAGDMADRGLLGELKAVADAWISSAAAAIWRWTGQPGATWN